jgi:dTDP-4-dehydrorhamnose reductase
VKILLLGANGQLGRTFLDCAGPDPVGQLQADRAVRREWVAASRDGVLTGGGNGEIADLAAPDSLAALLDRVQPDVIINAAAYTAVDRAEQEAELAYRVNGEAVAVLGAWAKTYAALVVHYSTDYVFDGDQSQPYAVDAPTAPLGAYGRSKLAGEQALRNSGADHLILRTAWVYAAHGHNFLRTMLRLGSERDELRVVADQHGAPTDTKLIVRATLAALDRWQQADRAQRQRLSGTHHLVASGATTWHGFATAIFEQAAAHGLITQSPRVIPITTADFPTPAIRPAWSLLDNSGFQQHFQFLLPDWQKGLDEVMRQLARSGR